jgi:hypothetical protein
MAKKPQTKDNELAQLIIDKIKDQVGTLAGREWPDIGRILDTDEEIDLAFKVSIVDRKPKPGETADKDNQIKTTIAFSEKYTSKIDSPLPDVNQPDLPIDEPTE